MTGVHMKVRKTKGGAKKYLCYYRMGGRKFKDVYAGSFDTKAEYRIRRDLIAAELAAGREPAILLERLRNPPPPPLPEPGLLHRWDEFIASRGDVTQSAKDLYRNSRDKWVPILGADIDPKTITPRDIIDGIAALTEDLMPSSIRHYRSSLAQVLDFCDVEPNPARSKKVRLPRGGASTIEIPTTRAWFAIRDQSKKRSHGALRLIEADGLRVSEAANLECQNIDFIDGWVLIDDAKTVAGRRWLPVPRDILDDIEDGLPEPADRPATMLAFGVNAQAIRYDLERACLSAGVGNYSPHELRHRRLSLWYRHGINPITVKGWAGHTRASMGLDTYGHVVLDPREDEWRDFWMDASVSSRTAQVRHPEDV